MTIAVPRVLVSCTADVVTAVSCQRWNLSLTFIGTGRAPSCPGAVKISDLLQCTYVTGYRIAAVIQGGLRVMLKYLFTA
jgi:hypothetical protein